MQVPLQVTFRNMGPSEALEARIREKAEKLDKCCENLLSCRVVVEAPHKHQRKGGIFHTRIDITLPGETIVVNREPDLHQSYTDINVSIRDAFNAARRQLQEYVSRRKGQIKTHETVSQGRISEIFPAEDYGRIVTAGGDDIYFHRNSVLNADKGLAALPLFCRYLVCQEEASAIKGRDIGCPLRPGQGLSGLIG